MDRVLVVGRQSFIAGSLLTRYQEGTELRAVPHDAVSARDLLGVSCIINMSLHPDFKSMSYDEARDADLAVARMAARHGCHYIMMSSRKVYGTSSAEVTYSETDPINPSDHYGHNKATSELRVRDELGSSATIVRGSNIFGVEPGRTSFMGWCIDQLIKTGTIRYDLSPMIKRDFIPVGVACDALLRLASIRPGGTYNLGSGVATEVGHVAGALIHGYGNGTLIADGSKMCDQFVLDNGKLSSLIGIPLWSNDILESVKQIGRFVCRTW